MTVTNIIENQTHLLSYQNQTCPVELSTKFSLFILQQQSTSLHERFTARKSSASCLRPLDLMRQLDSDGHGNCLYTYEQSLSALPLNNCVNSARYFARRVKSRAMSCFSILLAKRMAWPISVAKGISKSFIGCSLWQNLFAHLFLAFIHRSHVFYRHFQPNGCIANAGQGTFKRYPNGADNITLLGNPSCRVSTANEILRSNSCARGPWCGSRFSCVH